MAEVLIEFVNELEESGVVYEARACGRQREDGLWEGWIEFDPRGGTETVRTGRETTQPNEADLRYWATGLTGGYLEGALDRALRPATPAKPRERAVRNPPRYGGPAPDRARASETRGATELGHS
jgi:hypothetical protein